MKKTLFYVLILGLSNVWYQPNIRWRRGEVIDRVCTMQIDKDEADTLTKDGYTYYFCSNNCKTTFAKSPEKYACICPQLHEGCDCGHCAGKGVPCRCAEANADSHAGEHER